MPSIMPDAPDKADPYFSNEPEVLRSLITQARERAAKWQTKFYEAEASHTQADGIQREQVRLLGERLEAVAKERDDAISALSEGSEAFALKARTAETLDAERYRYLRDAAGQYMGDEDGPMVCEGLSDLFEYLRGVEVDESVDAAIARWKAAGSPLPKTPEAA